MWHSPFNRLSSSPRKNPEECRAFLEHALQEMILAYRQQEREIPPGKALLEQISIVA